MSTANRFFPAPSAVTRALASLLHPEGVARLRSLGIGPEAFDGYSGEIAAVLVSGREFTNAETTRLWKRGRGEFSWGETIDNWTIIDPARQVEKFAAWAALRWLPDAMEREADKIRRGKTDMRDVRFFAQLVEVGA